VEHDRSAVNLHSRRRNRLILAGLLLVGLLVAALARGNQQRVNDQLIQARVSSRSERALAALSAVLRIYGYGLRGARGAIIGAGGESISRARFRDYARSREIEQEFPGALGYGLIRRVSEHSERAFIEEAQRDGWPGFALRTLRPHQGDRFVIQYVEPIEQNAAAVGLDVASEPTRRAAALDAIRTGQATISGPVQLVQLTSVNKTGFLLFLPVYRAGQNPSTAAEREASTFGWVYAPLSLQRVLDSFDFLRGELTMRLADASDVGPPVTLFVTPGHRREETHVGRHSLDVFGRRWLVELAPGPELIAELRLANPNTIAAQVFALALVLAVLACRYLRRLESAQADAARRNQELEERVSTRTEELRRSNELLRISTAQLQTAQRITSVGSWDFDVETGHVHWSDELFRIFGLERTESAPDYRDQVELFTEESWARLGAAIEHSLATSEPYELELTALRADGAKRTTVARAEVLVGAAGKAERLVGTLQDTTGREEAAAQLRRVSDRLNLATSAARIGVWEWDIETGGLVWDQTMHHIYGTRPDSSSGLYEMFRSAVHGEDLEMVERALQSAVSGLGDYRSTFRIVREGGEIRHIDAYGVIERDRSSRATRMIGVNWDITERRTVELALRSTEATQRAILAHAGSAIIATTCDGTITLFNRAAEELLGYAADDLVGRATPYALHLASEVDARREQLERELNTVIAAPFDVFVIKARSGRPDVNEWTYVRHDGEHVPVLIAVTSMRDDSGQIFGYLGVVTNLSTQKQHERTLLTFNELLAQRSEQAESASRAKTLFLANMSHEIRTPIGALTGLTYLLSRTPLSAEQRDLLDTLQRSTQTLLRMVNDVLDLSKIEARQLNLEMEPFGLAELLTDIAKFMSAYSTGKVLELVLDTSDCDVTAVLLGDRLRMMQVLTNLVGNAIKYTCEGSVRLAVRQGPARDERLVLRFEVQDTGPGIEPSFLAQLFHTFAQAERRDRGRSDGTGLGLSIVKQLVSLMEGEVGVQTTLGTGSTFWCEIPFARTGTVQLAAHAPAELSVLVADDHEAQRLALTGCVEQLGWKAEVAESGQQVAHTVLRRARSGQPIRVLILDSELGGMEAQSLAALHATLASESFEPPLTVVTTLRDISELREPSQAALTDAWAQKPLTAGTLVEAVLRATMAREGTTTGAIAPPHSEAGERLSDVVVLVVDDSEVNRDIARRILNLEGARVELAFDGAHAVERVLATGSAFDVVLMDVQMPGEDGIAATRRIRANAGFATLPILALTAGALASEQERALAAGMNDYITKPYDPEVLISRVRAHVAAARGTPVEIRERTQQLPDRPNWPELEGIDGADASLRVSGDLTLFSRLLRRLVEELDEARREHVLDVAPDKVPGLLNWLHRMRGMAGNLGALELASVAREMEGALHLGDLERARVAAAELDSRLVRLCDGSRVYLGGTGGREVSLGSEAGAELDRGGLELLCGHLRDQKLEALAVFTTLAGPLEAALGSHKMSLIRAALDRLDFSTVLELISPCFAASSRDGAIARA